MLSKLKRNVSILSTSSLGTSILYLAKTAYASSINPKSKSISMKCERMVSRQDIASRQSSKSLIGFPKIFSCALIKSTILSSLLLYLSPKFFPSRCFHASDSIKSASLKFSKNNLIKIKHETKIL